MIEEYVASFRIPASLKQRIEAEISAHPVPGLRSANQYLRKVALDAFHAVSGIQPEPEQPVSQPACKPKRPTNRKRASRRAQKSDDLQRQGYEMLAQIDHQLGDKDEAYGKFIRSIHEPKVVVPEYYL